MNEKKLFSWKLGLIADTWLGYIFWSLIIELVSAVYFLNLATLSINASILFLGMILTPVVLGNYSIRQLTVDNLVVTQGLMVVGVLGYLVPDAFFRTLLLGIGAGGALLSLGGMWLTTKSRRERALWGFLLGLIVLLIFRWAWFSRNPIWALLEFNILAALLTMGVIELIRKEKNFLSEEKQVGDPTWILSSLGFGSVFFLSHWLFSNYGVIPRWVTLSPFPWGILIILILSLGLIIALSSWKKANIWGIISFLGAVLLAYGDGLWGFLGGLLLGLTLPPLWFLIIENVLKRPPGRTYFLGLLVYLFFLFGSVFTVTYDYVPGGWLFREREELILLISILFLILGTERLFLGFPSIKIVIPRQEVLIALGLISIVGLLSATVFRVSMDQLHTNPETTPLSLMTYNIQQGFDVDGNVNFEDVAQVIRDSKARIIGLQETDTLRVSSANRDIVEWLAEDLDMNSYAGPKTRDSTFGNALLSAYTIQKTNAIILPSEGELAVLLVSAVKVDTTVVNVLNAHFGEDEEDRTAQAEKTIEIINALTEPIILLGDFNSEPNSPQIQTILDAGMNDAYADTHDGEHVSTTGQTDKATIDFVFYRGLTLESAEVIVESNTSDHYPVLATFSL